MAGPLVGLSTSHPLTYTKTRADTHSFTLLSDMAGPGSSLQAPIHHTLTYE